MAQKFLSSTYTQLAAALLVLFGVLVTVYPHSVSYFSWVVNYAVQLMLTYLLVGMVFLFFKQPKLTFIFFGGCLLLSFYLKFSIKNNHIERWRNSMLRKYKTEEEDVQLSAAQFNLTNNSTPEEMLNAFRASKSDLISIHEVTPGWSQWLEDSLSQTYPFHHTMEDLGIFGMSIFSRFPLNSVDTFYYEEIPCLRACLQKEGLDLCVINVHTEPALNDYSLRRLQGELETLTAQISRMDMPILVMGDFNAVSWSKELQQFMTSTGLLESRSGFMDRQGSLWDVPVDHIFHSSRLGCTDFNNLSDRAGNHLGIKASFSLIPLAKNVKKTAQ